MNWIYVIFVLFHLICILTAFVGIRSGLLKVHSYLFFVVCCLPFWGFLIVLILHGQVLIEQNGNREIKMEKMQLDSELFRGIAAPEKNANAFIPMEEALLINTKSERRELIMDVLNDNPREYISFLQKAGNNDDTEVVHYAVTAMVEIAKENDYRLQQLERAYAKEPDNGLILQEYCDFLWNCLEQNLMQGQVERMNRNLFASLMGKKLLTSQALEDYEKLAKNQMKLNDYTQAGAILEKMDRRWPDHEKVILLKLQYFAATGRGDAIQELLAHIEKKQIYLSRRAREAVAFWKL